MLILRAGVYISRCGRGALYCSLEMGRANICRKTNRELLEILDSLDKEFSGSGGSPATARQEEMERPGEQGDGAGSREKGREVVRSVGGDASRVKKKRRLPRLAPPTLHLLRLGSQSYPLKH